jgi:molybdenum cofactor cytidylyltransferase
MRLFDVLGLKHGEMVCFVGAGGKTGLMLRLASECASGDRRVLVTTSTRMFVRQLQDCGELILEPETDKLLGKLADAAGGRSVAAGAGLTEEGKLVGLGREALDAIHRAGLFDIILVEADGSRGKPLKAPAPHEPVLPSMATCVVAVIGAEVLGSPLTEQHVHRWRLAAEVAGQDAGSTITASTILKIVNRYRDLAREASPGSRFIPAVNKADRPVLLHQARAIAGCLLPSVERVLITSAVLGDPVLEVLS